MKGGGIVLRGNDKMLMLKAEGCKATRNEKVIFENVHLDIEEKQRVAIIGSNGVGKTTLLKALFGKVQLEKGKIMRRYPADAWGWVEQMEELADVTLYEYVSLVRPELATYQKKIDELQKKMSIVTKEELEGLMEEYTTFYERFMAMDGFQFQTEIEKHLSQLQLPPASWYMPYSQLSGGEKTRAQLARTMLKNPKFLILDEPTNHLDKDAIEWLTNWIKASDTTVLFVSHDRHFIDQVADVTYELTAGGTKKYKGGYSAYKKQKDHEILTHQKLYAKQEQKKKELLESINRYKQWFQQAQKSSGKDDSAAQKNNFSSRATKSASRFKALEKALDRLEKNKIEKYKEADRVKLDFHETDFGASRLLQIRQMKFGYDGIPLFKDFNLDVKRSERLAVIGPNGSGKTTLLQLILGRKQPEEGMVQLHPRCKVGYFSQELSDLDGSDTILDHIMKIPNLTQTEARTILGCFLFKRDNVLKRISHLSMGEKCRVAFVKLYFSGADLLILDEPNNYLDIETRETIEEALQEFPGTIIAVSHDKYFLRKIADRILDLGSTSKRVFEGSYSDYERNKQNKELKLTVEMQNELFYLEIKRQNYLADSPVNEEEQEELLAKIYEINQKIDKIKKQAYKQF